MFSCITTDQLANAGNMQDIATILLSNIQSKFHFTRNLKTSFRAIPGSPLPTLVWLELFLVAHTLPLMHLSGLLQPVHLMPFYLSPELGCLGILLRHKI